ncbi:HEAT repeat domain-containing protein [Cellulomonas soli]|uniref:HEAT repeat domain-containing protein n=1 Tax=Cellulomonas soli TaxID=931535 RepID=UPI003F82CDE0
MTERLGTTATWLLLASGAVVGLLLVAIVAARSSADLRRRTEAARRTLAMPMLMDVIDGKPVPVPRRRRHAQALALAASDLVHKVRGADRDLLATWLTDAGFRQDALRSMRSPWAPRRARAIELYLATTSGLEPEPVVTMLRDPHPRVRLAAVRALGDSGAREAVPALVRAAGSRRRPVPPSAVAMAIVHAAPPDASAMRHVWTSRDPVLVSTALTVCGHLGLVDARPQIEHLLGSRDHQLRVRAVEALGRIGDPRSALPLRRASHLVPPGSVEGQALRRALEAVGVDQPRFGA